MADFSNREFLIVHYSDWLAVSGKPLLGRQHATLTKRAETSYLLFRGGVRFWTESFGLLSKQPFEPDSDHTDEGSELAVSKIASFFLRLFSLRSCELLPTFGQ